jgi:hypothetical protein
MPPQTDHAQAEYRKIVTGLVDGTNKLTGKQIAAILMRSGHTPDILERDIAAARAGRTLSSRPRPQSRVASVIPPAPSGYLVKPKIQPPPTAKLRSFFREPPQTRSAWGPNDSQPISE